MSFDVPKPRRDRPTQARVWGVIGSPYGWQRFQAAKQQAESNQILGKRLTQEDLSDRTERSLNTLARIFKRELGVDRQSLELLFQAFGLHLTKTRLPPLPINFKVILGQYYSPPRPDPS